MSNRIQSEHKDGLIGGNKMRSKREQLIRAVVFVSTVSSILIANLTLGYYIGGLLDEYLFNFPWGRIIGIVLGMGTAVWSVIRTLKNDFLKIKGKEDKLRVYTTRCDTLFGVTYMVVSPEHPILEKYKNEISNFDADIFTEITGIEEVRDMAEDAGLRSGVKEKKK